MPPYPPDVPPGMVRCDVVGPSGRCRLWMDDRHRCCAVLSPGEAHGHAGFPHGCLCRREWVS